MKTTTRNTRIQRLSKGSFLTILTYILFSCEFLNVEAPRTDLVKSTVFSNDVSATAAMMDIYYSMSRDGFASGNLRSVSHLAALSADELTDINTARLSPDLPQFYDCSLTPLNTAVDVLWSSAYSIIYKANAIIEGLQKPTGITDAKRSLLEGEARFIRAFCHFYLVNLFGDVPVITTTDYLKNRAVARSESSVVFDFIISELKLAKDMLPQDYTLFNQDRVRATSLAATALLSRVYLYTEEWNLAEIESTSLIDNENLQLDELESVFKKNSPESIFQLETQTFPNDLFSFYIFSAASATTALSDKLLAGFSPDDGRRIAWVRSASDGNVIYYFAAKYKSFDLKAEYSTVLRLGEQYLIRAEARVRQNNLEGALEDLNVIRGRANAPLVQGTDADATLQAILHERKLELFTEWGHRWLDLKRTSQVNEALAEKPNWKSTSALYPIPQSQILNSSISQNPGY